jgi:hypothetical protein
MMVPTSHKNTAMGTVIAVTIGVDVTRFSVRPPPAVYFVSVDPQYHRATT